MIKYLPLLLIILFSCTRKLHTSRTTTTESNTVTAKYDSLNEIIRTLSSAYEELLASKSSLGVTFDTTPCDSGMNITTMPRIVEHADGSREFIGRIKSYQSDVSKYQRAIFSMQARYDSLLSVSRVDSSHHEASAVVVVRKVKSSFIPWWIIVLAVVAGLLWVNERFRVFKVPLLTKS